MATLTEPTWEKLMRRIRHEIESVLADSGYGRVTVTCAAGSPHEILAERSLRVERDVLEEKIPELV